jgi:hypothetical protein
MCRCQQIPNTRLTWRRWPVASPAKTPARTSWPWREGLPEAHLDVVRGGSRKMRPSAAISRTRASKPWESYGRDAMGLLIDTPQVSVTPLLPSMIDVLIPPTTGFAPERRRGAIGCRGAWSCLNSRPVRSLRAPGECGGTSLRSAALMTPSPARKYLTIKHRTWCRKHFS